MASTGTITQVIGSTFDAQFAEDKLPSIYSAVKIDADTPVGRLVLTGEVQQHLGGGKVRAVALGSTDGLRRGMTCLDTGGPVMVPVGEAALGRGDVARAREVWAPLIAALDPADPRRADLVARLDAAA